MIQSLTQELEKSKKQNDKDKSEDFKQWHDFEDDEDNVWFSDEDVEEESHVSVIDRIHNHFVTRSMIDEISWIAERLKSIEDG